MGFLRQCVGVKRAIFLSEARDFFIQLFGVEIFYSNSYGQNGSEIINYRVLKNFEKHEYFGVCQNSCKQL